MTLMLLRPHIEPSAVVSIFPQDTEKQEEQEKEANKLTALYQQILQLIWELNYRIFIFQPFFLTVEYIFATFFGWKKKNHSHDDPFLIVHLCHNTFNCECVDL